MNNKNRFKFLEALRDVSKADVQWTAGFVVAVVKILIDLRNLFK